MKCKYLDHQVCIRTSGEFRLCCISNEPTNKENIQTHTIEEWRESKVFKDAEQKFDNNEFPEACKKCEIQESSGEGSQRTKPRPYGPGVSHLDLRFGSNCNLKCTMCYPATSSGVNQDHKELIAKGMESPWGNEQFPNYDWYTEERGDYLASLPELREVYLTGGEPMMVRGLHKFLKKLDNSVEIRFNTNATIINPNVYEELKRFDTVNMCFSIDGIGKVNDYIRWGSDWQTVETNMLRWAEFVKYKSVGPTIQIMNLHNYDNIVAWAKTNDFDVFDNLLFHPTYFDSKNAPDTIKKFAPEKFKYWVNQEPDQIQQNAFLHWIKTFDKLRGCHIQDYIPEVAEAYGINKGK